MKKKLSLVVVSLLVSQSLFADGVSPQVSSDYKSTALLDTPQIDLTLPSIDVYTDEGGIKQKPFKFNAGVGGFVRSDDSSGGRFKLDTGLAASLFGKDYVSDQENEYKKGSLGYGHVELGVDAQVNIRNQSGARNEVDRIKVKGPKVSLFDGREKIYDTDLRIQEKLSFRIDPRFAPKDATVVLTLEEFLAFEKKCKEFHTLKDVLETEYDKARDKMEQNLRNYTKEAAAFLSKNTKHKEKDAVLGRLKNEVEKANEKAKKDFELEFSKVREAKLAKVNSELTSWTSTIKQRIVNYTKQKFPNVPDSEIEVDMYKMGYAHEGPLAWRFMGENAVATATLHRPEKPYATWYGKMITAQPFMNHSDAVGIEANGANFDFVELGGHASHKVGAVELDIAGSAGVGASAMDLSVYTDNQEIDRGIGIGIHGMFDASLGMKINKILEARISGNFAHSGRFVGPLPGDSEGDYAGINDATLNLAIDKIADTPIGVSYALDYTHVDLNRNRSVIEHSVNMTTAF